MAGDLARLNFAPEMGSIYGSMKQDRKEPREILDRRKKPTNPFSLASLRGRRREIRRVEDRNIHYYVDRYDTFTVSVFVLVILLSIADAFITLRLVAHGGEEINPVMNLFLSQGVYPFLAVKYVLTGLGVFFMVLHKEYYFFGGKLRGVYLLLGILLLYIALIFWEFYLLSHL